MSTRTTHQIMHRIEGSNLAVAIHRHGGKRPYIIVRTDTLSYPPEFTWTHSSNTPMPVRFASAGSAAVAAAELHISQLESA